MKKQTAIFLVMFTTVSAFGQNDSTPQKTNDIKKLLEITNVQQQAEQLFELFVPQIQSLSPLVPQEFWALFRKNLDFGSYVSRFIPVYDRHYTHREIRELIAFYESPPGKKVVDVNPKMAEESIAIGQAWGMELGQKILEHMKKEGYLDT